eukprot:GHVQ01038578.1.p1 GENE.GHVQ01038578.1~~GHVQ01038578.1.p1  ORF type:complete len:291 (+),score=16.12 GHVQ01038578.1:274-1146(+)
MLARCRKTAGGHFTKWPEVFATRDATAACVGKCLYSLFLRYGCPKNLLTDNGPAFIAHMFADLCKRLKITKLWSSPYHPQGNGIAEAFMKVLGNQLAILVEQKLGSWPAHIPTLLAAYRALPHPSTGETPFFLLHGYDPAWPSDLAFAGGSEQQEPSVTNTGYAERIQDMQEARVAAARRLLSIFQQRISAADTSSIPTYAVGQIVWKRVMRTGMSTRFLSKLSDKWEGPMRVLRCHQNGLTYDLRSLVHGTVTKAHVSLTKPFVPLSREEMIDLYATLPAIAVRSERDL